jgi:hypothetical protein
MGNVLKQNSELNDKNIICLYHLGLEVIKFSTQMGNGLVGYRVLFSLTQWVLTFSRHVTHKGELVKMLKLRDLGLTLRNPDAEGLRCHPGR